MLVTAWAWVVLLRRNNHRAVLTLLGNGHPLCFGQNEETNM